MYPNFSRQLQEQLLKSFIDTSPDMFTASNFSGDKGKDYTKDSNGILLALSSIGLTDPAMNESYQQIANSLPTGTSVLPLITLSKALPNIPEASKSQQQRLYKDVMMVALQQIGSPNTNAGSHFF